MLPRGLTSRIVLAFAGLSAAMLVAVAVTLFLVLHQLHQNEIEDTLSRQLVQVVVNLSREPVAQWDATLQDAGGPIADDGGYILVQNPNGAIRVLAGSPSSLTIPTGPTLGPTKTSDGKDFMSRSYGVRPGAAEPAAKRVIAILGGLSRQLHNQKAKGSPYFVGDRISAPDVYWACFSQLVGPLPEELCPMGPDMRQVYGFITPEIAKAVDPILMQHRDLIWEKHIGLPMDF